jgi:hypothetical protein
LPPQLPNKVFEIVVELAIITDIAAGARTAVASDVGRDDQDVVCR